MSEYMGDHKAVALQKALRFRADEIAGNPLLSNGGRVMNILDPEAFGWDNVKSAARQDGFIGLTMVDRDTTLLRLAKEFDKDTAFPYWSAFTGTPDHVLSACAVVRSEISVPDGWTTTYPTHPDDRTIHQSQVLNSATGVAPTPAYYLRGDQIPSMLACLWDNNGALAACASGTMRYHPKSSLAGWFFAGAVSVSPAHRRMGLGSYVNAMLLEESQRVFNWSTVLEQAKGDNAPSVGMIARCGLRQPENKVTIVISTTGESITR